MIHLPRRAGKIAIASSDESGRYAMQSVRLRRQGATGWRLDATDGRMLAVLQGDSEPSKADQRDAPPLPEAMSLMLEGLIPAEEFAKAFKTLPKDEYMGPRHVGVQLGEVTLLVSGNAVLSTRLVEGKYPPVDSVLPKGPAFVSFTIDPTRLIEMLTIARSVCEKGDDAVEILYYGRGKPLGLRSKAADGMVFDAILMPMTPPALPPKPEAVEPPVETPPATIADPDPGDVDDDDDDEDDEDE